MQRRRERAGMDVTTPNMLISWVSCADSLAHRWLSSSCSRSRRSASDSPPPPFLPNMCRAVGSRKVSPVKRVVARHADVGVLSAAAPAAKSSTLNRRIVRADSCLSRNRDQTYAYDRWGNVYRTEGGRAACRVACAACPDRTPYRKGDSSTRHTVPPRGTSAAGRGEAAAVRRWGGASHMRARASLVGAFGGLTLLPARGVEEVAVGATPGVRLGADFQVPARAGKRRRRISREK